MQILTFKNNVYLHNPWSNKGLNGIVVNLTCHSINGRSLEDTLTVPLSLLNKSYEYEISKNEFWTPKHEQVDASNCCSVTASPTLPRFPSPAPTRPNPPSLFPRYQRNVWSSSVGELISVSSVVLRCVTLVISSLEFRKIIKSFGNTKFAKFFINYIKNLTVTSRGGGTIVMWIFCYRWVGARRVCSQKHWVLIFYIFIPLQPNNVDFRYFMLWILLNQII